MTTPGEHPGQEDPINPEHSFLGDFGESLDGFDIGILAESDLGDVPLHYGLQQTIDAMSLAARITIEGVTPEVATGITEHFTESEDRYPGAPIWDKQRSLLARAVMGYDRDIAMDLLTGMHSFHRMAHEATILAIEYAGLGHDQDAFLGDFLTHLEVGSPRFNKLVRAFADRLIDIEPHSPLIASMEGMLSNSQPDFDPVQSWAASQRELYPQLYPQLEWDTIVDLVKRDAIWTGVPLNVRRFAAKLHVTTLERLNLEPTLEAAMTAADNIDDLERQYPEATMWDTDRLTLAATLIESQKIDIVKVLSSTFKNPTIQGAVVVLLATEGFEADAFETAVQITDPKLRAKVLMNRHWVGEAGGEYIAEVINDTTGRFDEETRLSFMEVMREQFVLAVEPQAIEAIDLRMWELGREDRPEGGELPE